jgi:hypothetical protein
MLGRRIVVQRQQLKRLENCAQRGDSSLAMKSILITTIAAVVLYLEWHGQGADMRAIPNNQFYINERALQ